ncbi:MAG: regulatory protein RecX [Candidatus Contendobacter sp.]|nr:regulatory protein RecX [Candidatus Contendobacter sp.]
MNWTRTFEKTVATDPGTVRAKALELLARREHSRLELRQKLIQRGYPPTQIDPVLDQLVEERWLDEGRYAELYASTRADKGYGPLRIARELRERGVPDEQVTTSLAALNPFWLPKLRELHRKRFKALVPTDVAGRMQQTRVLRQHGFTLDQIKYLFETFETI